MVGGGRCAPSLIAALNLDPGTVVYRAGLPVRVLCVRVRVRVCKQVRRRGRGGASIALDRYGSLGS